MELSRKFEKILTYITMASLAIVFLVLMNVFPRDTFAEDENSDTDIAGANYITFFDGGEKLTVKSEAISVADAIARAGIVLNDGDIVNPAMDEKINSSDYYINIYRARPVLVKDGLVEKYIMTASYDAKTIAHEAGMSIYDGDEVEMRPSYDFLETGLVNVYEIKRNGGRTLTVDEEIPFEEETINDPTLDRGKNEVRQLGEVGAKRLYYNVQYIDNQEVSRELVAEEVIRQPVSRVVAVGAKRSAPPGSETCAEWARQAGVSEADLTAALDLIYRESGCRVDAANPSGAYGIPQALPGSKMASVGADWETNPVTQIRWMIGYVNGRYGGWNQALTFWYAHGWY